jgi:hypothetical protein
VIQDPGFWIEAPGAPAEWSHLVVETATDGICARTQAENILRVIYTEKAKF